jgi:hypothetical protein
MGGVGELRIHPISKDALLFCLNVNRGEPSYIMGLASEQIKILGKAITWLITGMKVVLGNLPLGAIMCE